MTTVGNCVGRGVIKFCGGICCSGNKSLSRNLQVNGFVVNTIKLQLSLLWSTNNVREMRNRN